MQREERDTTSAAERAVGPGRMPVELEERDIDFRFHALAILNRRWMILTLTALVLIVATIYSFMTTPVYRSKAVVDLSPPPTYIILPESQPLVMRNESFINTQHRLLEAKSLAERVAKKLTLAKQDLKGRGFVGKGRATNISQDEMNDVTDRLLDMVKILPIPETNLCDIVFTTPDPRLSQALANTWAQEYASQRVDSIHQYTRTTEELLVEQVKSLQKEISEGEKALHEFSLKEDIIKIDKGQSINDVNLSNISSDLTSATRDRIAAEIRYQALRTSAKESIPEVQQHPEVQQKANEIAQLQSKYQDKSRLYKEDYPEMTRMREQITQAQNGIEAVWERAYQQVLSVAQTNYKESLIKESTLKSRLSQARHQSADSGRKELDYDQIAMEIDNKKDLLTVLLQKQNQTDVSAEVQQKTMPGTRVVENAQLPKKVFSPNIKKNLLFAFFGGLIGSIGLALLLDYFDRTLRTADDVEHQLRLPYLGMIPFYVGEQQNGNKNGDRAVVKLEQSETALDQKHGRYLLGIFDSSSLASEAIKTIRTSILLGFPGAPPRSILVTSSRAGEGKTFLASNLAVSLTQMDKRVIIIDADMRNPNVHKAWNLPNNVGLSIYLTHNIPISDVIKKTPISELVLMTSGPKTPRPAELLASAKFKDLLTQLENDFDFVIVDSPPVLPVADSVILASRVESVLMVVRGGATPRDVVKMAKKKLHTSNGVIAGAVLNGIDLADPYYYYRYYSEYYSGYYADADKKNAIPGNGSSPNEL